MATNIVFDVGINDSGLGQDGTAYDFDKVTALITAVEAAVDVEIAAVAAVVQTTTSVGAQNNFALTAKCAVLRCNNATLLTLSGLAAGVDGQRIEIVSIGAGQVDLTNQDTASTAANRLINGVTGTRSLAPGVGWAVVVYDTTTARWRVTAHEQGAWITPTFAAGNFTAGGSQTWTVEAGDVTSFAYLLKGRTLTVMWWIVTTSVGGTAHGTLFIAIPGGLTALKNSLHPITVVDAGGTTTVSYCTILASATTIGLWRPGNVVWSAATNTTSAYGTVTFEVP